MMKVAVARTPRMGIAAGLIAVLAASVSLAPLAASQNGKPIAVTPPGGAMWGEKAFFTSHASWSSRPKSAMRSSRSRRVA